MPRHTSTKVLMVCMSVLMAIAMVGCSSSSSTGNTGGSTNTGSGMMGGSGSSGSGSSGSGSSGMMGGSGSSSGNYASVGEQIYLTGVGSDDQAIQRTAPAVSQGSLMMSGNGCGSCHGVSGRGGTIKMMMGTAIKAPDITYGALIKEGFTDVTIKRAITKGLDEADKPLEVAMPRWQMSTTDLDATISYLKQLGS